MKREEAENTGPEKSELIIVRSTVEEEDCDTDQSQEDEEEEFILYFGTVNSYKVQPPCILYWRGPKS